MDVKDISRERLESIAGQMADLLTLNKTEIRIGRDNGYFDVSNEEIDAVMNSEAFLFAFAEPSSQIEPEKNLSNEVPNNEVEHTFEFESYDLNSLLRLVHAARYAECIEWTSNTLGPLVGEKSSLAAIEFASKLAHKVGRFEAVRKVDSRAERDWLGVVSVKEMIESEKVSTADFINLLEITNTVPVSSKEDVASIHLNEEDLSKTALEVSGKVKPRHINWLIPIYSDGFDGAVVTLRPRMVEKMEDIIRYARLGQHLASFTKDAKLLEAYEDVWSAARSSIFPIASKVGLRDHMHDVMLAADEEGKLLAASFREKSCLGDIEKMAKNGIASTEKPCIELQRENETVREAKDER